MPGWPPPLTENTHRAETPDPQHPFGTPGADRLHWLGTHGRRDAVPYSRARGSVAWKHATRTDRSHRTNRRTNSWAYRKLHPSAPEPPATEVAESHARTRSNGDRGPITHDGSHFGPDTGGSAGSNASTSCHGRSHSGTHADVLGNSSTDARATRGYVARDRGSSGGSVLRLRIGRLPLLAVG